MNGQHDNKRFASQGTSSGYQRQLALIRQRWPEIAYSIENAPCQESVGYPTDSPESTLVIDGVHLSSGYAQRAEATLQASLVPLQSATAWVYGIGCGELPRALLSRKNIESLTVVMLNPAIFRESLAYFDHSDWLLDGRVKIVAASMEEDVHFPLAAVPSCLQLADDASARLRDLVFLELSTPFIREKHSAVKPELVQRVKGNINFVRADGDVATLFDSKKAATILLAAAGPTLADHYSWIKNNREHTLIAVDAAVRPLVQAGIYPDLVVTIDRDRAGVTAFLTDFDLSLLKQTALVYFPLVHEDVLTLWPGPRLTAYSEHALYQDLAEAIPKGTLFSSGSVLHPAADLAVAMGAANVILFGADFSFPAGSSHVQGSAASRPLAAGADTLWVLNGRGERVSTGASYRGFLRDFERYIQKHPETVFINSSRRGARIQGTCYLEDIHP